MPDPAQVQRVLQALARGGKLPPSVRHQLRREQHERRQDRKRKARHKP